MAKNLKPGEKPILFSGPMIQAILNTKPNIWPPEPIDPGKPWKWQTRRLPSKRVIDKWYEYDDWCNAVMGGILGATRMYEKSFYEQYAPYEVGQRLWVREKWGDIGSYDDGNGYRTHYAYAADFAYGTGFHEYSGDLYVEDEIHWKSSRFMPKAAARIWLEITNVRVERLQEITEEDAKAEGVAPATTPDIQGKGRTYKQGFGLLWNELNAKRGYGWDTSPWVWRIEFGRVE